MHCYDSKQIQMLSSLRKENFEQFFSMFMEGLAEMKVYRDTQYRGIYKDDLAHWVTDSRVSDAEGLCSLCPRESLRKEKTSLVPARVYTRGRPVH